ncbi:hypothetical protein [Enterococcus sp. N249-2]
MNELQEQLDEIREQIMFAEWDNQSQEKIDDLWKQYNEVEYKYNQKDCHNCNEKIYVGGNGYMGAYECHCGSWINKFGQALRPPSEWEEF